MSGTSRSFREGEQRDYTGQARGQDKGNKQGASADAYISYKELQDRALEKVDDVAAPPATLSWEARGVGYVTDVSGFSRLQVAGSR
jgi:hypothetical protein